MLLWDQHIKESKGICLQHKKNTNKFRNIKFLPMHIGEYVIIEQNSIICASKIGNYVHIGKNCIVVH